ncbi:MAG: DedA family protein [Lysobacter sp.]|nr:MAG: DedA family protein [Lysobacter sp.]
MELTLLTYAGLLAIAFASATILPLQSEALLAALLVARRDPVALVLVATVGNVAGSTVNWWLGRRLAALRRPGWLRISDASLQRAGERYRRYGKWSLLLSWVPVIGDPLTLMAGFLNERLTTFLMLVTIAKSVRYVLVTLIVLGLL